MSKAPDASKALSLWARIGLGASLVILGCGLPFAAERWVWSPVQLEIVNRAETDAVDQLEIESEDGVTRLGTLPPGGNASVVVRSHAGFLWFRVRHGADRRGERVRLHVFRGTRIQLAVGTEGAPRYRTVEPPSEWAVLTQ